MLERTQQDLPAPGPKIPFGLGVGFRDLLLRHPAGGTLLLVGKFPSFDVELGAVPTWDLHPHEIPVSLTMPTWLTVGPADFWGGSSKLGVFSTGLNARMPVEWVPQQYGQWSVNAGVQYYNLINSNLRNAQEVIGVVSPGSSGDRNVFVFAAGIGLHF
jgi:hypothetical protein